MISDFENIVGDRHVLTGVDDTSYYCSGFRSGYGEAKAVVFPGTLLEQWQVLQVCAKHKVAIIMQAAKTGLTGGSNPNGSDYGRDVIIVNTTRIKKIILLDGGRQVIALPGSSLHELEQTLKTVNRAPHSVLGSTTIGATVVGGVANNAGGALCKQGSSYTQLALYAKINKQGELELVDELGVNNLGDTPEAIFSTLERGFIPPEDVVDFDKPASDRDYADRIRDVDSPVPNRYNADPKRLYGLSGSAGKVAAFAVRVDTYPVPEKEKVFFLGANDPKHFVTMRQKILKEFKALPDMCEYMNRGIFDIAREYGKDVYLSIKYLGTERLPKAYALKAKAEYFLNKVSFLPKYLPDIALYWIAKLFPQHLPERMLQYRDKYQYYQLLFTSDDCIEETRNYLSQEWSKIEGVEYFECSKEESEAALLHRFAAAGAGVRYYNIHQKTTEPPLALDIALLSQDPEWVEELPEELSKDLDVALYYGHYMCHVFHNVYIYKKGADLKAIKKKMLELLDKKGAKYPAEHNVGHLYEAEPVQKAFYEELDPTNSFNPGIGKTSKLRQEPLASTPSEEASSPSDLPEEQLNLS